MEPEFTWINTYKDIALALLNYEDKQDVLIQMIKEMRNSGLPVISLSDQNPKDKELELEEIDPFTFFSNFNRGLKEENRISIIEYILQKFSLTSALPKDFTGIPVVDMRKAWFFAYKYHRKKTDIPQLWKLFKEALSPRGITEDSFNKVLGIRSIYRNITSGLFWVSPEKYLSLDRYNQDYLNFKVSKETLDYTLYMRITEQAKAKGKTFYELSRDAWLTPEVNFWVFQGNPNIYRIVDCLKDGAPLSWSILAHRDKIRKGDKVILWVTGESAGCYALCTITSDIINRKDDPSERKYYIKEQQDVSKDQVELNVDYNLWNKPILKDSIKDNPIFNDFKGGYQGTNFTATKEQYEALLSMVEPTETDRKYWLYAPGENARLWDDFYEKGIMGVGWDKLGNLEKFSDKSEIESKLKKIYKKDSRPSNDALACYDFCQTIKIGDIIIPKKGTTHYLGYGIVKSGYIFDDTRREYNNIRKVKWVKKGEWRDTNIVQKALTDISKYPDYVEKLKKLIGISIEEPKEPPLKFVMPLNQIIYGPPGTGKTYHSVDLAIQVIGLDAGNHSANQQIFREQLGKQIEFISFHQSYAYEDFIQGLRPITDSPAGGNISFELQDGVFKRIADRALNNYKAFKQGINKAAKPPFNKVFKDFIKPLTTGEVEEIEVKMPRLSFYITEVTDKAIHFRKHSGETAHSLSISTLSAMYDNENVGNIQGLGVYYKPLLNKLLDDAKRMKPEQTIEALKKYVIIIDEVNRANISKVFGELITLIEEDKRYGEDNELSATLPSGETFAVPPNLYIIGTMNTADKSIALLDIALRRRFNFRKMYPNPSLVIGEYRELFVKLNDHIIEERGSDFQIGHSFFMRKNDANFDLREAMNDKIIPLLYEYFMNDGEAVKQLLNSVGITTRNNGGIYEFVSYNLS